MPAARARCGRSPTSVAFRPRVDDRGDGDAGLVQAQRRFVGAVVVGEDDRARSGLDAVARDIGPRRAGEHRARQIVAGIGDAALERAAGEHDRAGAHVPQPLARRESRRLGQMVGDALDQADQVLVVVAERGRARQQRDVAHSPPARRCARRSSLRPARRRSMVASPRRLPPNVAFSSHSITRAPHAAAALRRGQARRSAADHQHVAVREAMLVVIGIGLARRAAEPRGAADRVLVPEPPARAGGHMKVL